MQFLVMSYVAYYIIIKVHLILAYKLHLAFCGFNKEVILQIDVSINRLDEIHLKLYSNTVKY